MCALPEKNGADRVDVEQLSSENSVSATRPVLYKGEFLERAPHLAARFVLATVSRVVKDDCRKAAHQAEVPDQAEVPGQILIPGMSATRQCRRTMVCPEA